MAITRQPEPDGMILGPPAPVYINGVGKNTTPAAKHHAPHPGWGQDYLAPHPSSVLSEREFDWAETLIQKLKRGAIVSLDTFTWQMLASVFWPGSFIRCVVNATALGLAVAHVDAEWAKAIPTAAGLAAIPFIVKPIDGTIDLAMEKSVTPALNGKLSGGEIPLAIGILGGCMVVPPTLFTVAAAIKDQIPA